MLTKGRKYYQRNWCLVNRFKTFIFIISCTINISDSLLSLFSLLLIVTLSESHQIQEKEKLNTEKSWMRKFFWRRGWPPSLLTPSPLPVWLNFWMAPFWNCFWICFAKLEFLEILIHNCKVRTISKLPKKYFVISWLVFVGNE